MQCVTRLALRFSRITNQPMTGDGVVNDERQPNDSDITGLFARGAEFIQEIPGRDHLHHRLGCRPLFTPLKGITFVFGPQETCPA